MKTRNKIVASLAAVVILGVAGSAYVVRAAEEVRGPFAGRIAERLAQLGVTDDQKSQVKHILKQHQPTAQPLLKEFVAQRRALRDLIHAEKVDEAAIRAQVDKLAKVGADFAVERARVAHEIRGVLTPEQIKKLGEMKVDVDARIDHVFDQVAKRIAED